MLLNLNVKIAPTHAGISVGPDGGSHQMLEDVSLMRGLPGMRVLVPADYAAARAALRLAAATPGPVYVRMGRAAVPCVYDDEVELEIGRAYVLREGSDVTIVANGVEIREALAAADALAADGISAEVIDAFSVKPLDGATILESVAKTRCVVTAEEHSVIGGLGSAVCELLAGADPVCVECVAVRDRFGKSGEFEELFRYFNIDATAIVEAVKRFVSARALLKYFSLSNEQPNGASCDERTEPGNSWSCRPSRRRAGPGQQRARPRDGAPARPRPEGVDDLPSCPRLAHARSGRDGRPHGRRRSSPSTM